MIVGKYYLLIEAKYSSGFSEETQTTKHQLVREIEGGLYEARSMGKIFKIIAVTANYFKPSDILNDVPTEFHSFFQWINWQQITLFISQILDADPRMGQGQRLLAEDLYRLLLKKNLRNFEGIKALELNQRIQEFPACIFFDASTASYRGDFIGFMQAFDFDPQLRRPSGRIFFAAATASFRGDFIGFTQALPVIQKFRLPIIPTNVFFSTDRQKQFFSFEGGNRLNAPEERIFFTGGTNE
jgi:hypothetical protein